MPRTVSTLERLRRLDEERNQLLEGARQEAMERVQEALAELNALGFNYQVVERGRGPSTARTARAGRISRKGTRSVKDAPCPICGFKTNPPHDRRAHRMQTTKKPFTDAELASRGMKKV